MKPYVLDDQMCDECQGSRCGGKFAPFFCANVTCLQYYCEHCWATIHSRPGREFHKPLVKEGADRPRAVPFRWCWTYCQILKLKNLSQFKIFENYFSMFLFDFILHLCKVSWFLFLWFTVFYIWSYIKYIYICMYTFLYVCFLWLNSFYILANFWIMLKIYAF